MKSKDQIIVLKALMAITLLTKNTSVDVLLDPEKSLAKNTENMVKLKYKLSVIEGIFLNCKNVLDNDIHKD